MRGIALDGWDRPGWPQRPRADEIDRLATRWMLWRDRRTVLAAGALAAGYVALVLAALASLWRPAEAAPYLSDGAIQFLATIMTLVMAWRLVMRCMFTARAHGWQQGILAAPRLLVSNIILIACSWRALAAYMAGLRGRPVAWDKTAHEIPPFAASLNPPAAARR